MARIPDTAIRTREVLDWQGLHLLHFDTSSCSQKTRIVLALTGLQWQSHPVDLGANASWDEWFLGINRRGMVPVLVVDGAVHVESNDIVRLLESLAGGPSLVPAGREAELDAALAAEDALHHDLRRLSFRFVHGRTGTTKSDARLEAYRADHAPPGGDDDQTEASRAAELGFYRRLAREGLNDAVCRSACANFRRAFDELEDRLEHSAFLLGPALSLLDIAWFVYAHRLRLAGYPLAALHPRVHHWYAGLSERPELIREVTPSPALEQAIARVREADVHHGTTLAQVAGWSDLAPL